MQDLERVKQLFSAHFSVEPAFEIRACGRINIIGEHTDYNLGFVLPAAIDKYIFFVAAKNGLDYCRIHAADINEFAKIPLDKPFEKHDQLWANYLIGILEQYRQREVVLEGLDCVFGGNLPVGSGMSSSAALETGFATLIKTAFSYEIEKPEMAKLAQASSHQFVGVPCGIMDQFASLMGKENQLVLLDCRSLDYQYIPCDLGDYQIVLINSKVSHNLSESAYETRVKECEKGVSIMQRYEPTVQSLRDVTTTMLLPHREALGDLIFKRCYYVTSENERLLKVCEHLKKGEIEEVGALLYETHEGLKMLYEVSCEEVDFLVDFAHGFAGVIGSRIMGGGFGGCSINLVKADRVAHFIEAIHAAYFKAYGLNTAAYQVKTVDGTDML